MHAKTKQKLEQILTALNHPDNPFLTTPVAPEEQLQDLDLLESLLFLCAMRRYGVRTAFSELKDFGYGCDLSLEQARSFISWAKEHLPKFNLNTIQPAALEAAQKAIERTEQKIAAGIEQLTQAPDPKMHQMLQTIKPYLVQAAEPKPGPSPPMPELHGVIPISLEHQLQLIAMIQWEDPDESTEKLEVLCPLYGLKLSDVSQLALWFTQNVGWLNYKELRKNAPQVTEDHIYAALESRH